MKASLLRSTEPREISYTSMAFLGRITAMAALENKAGKFVEPTPEAAQDTGFRITADLQASIALIQGADSTHCHLHLARGTRSMTTPTKHAIKEMLWSGVK